MLGKMLGELKGLVMLAAMGWLAWYGYTHWEATTADPADSAQSTSFNCRQALVKYAEDQASRRSNANSLSSDDLAQMKKRESDIEQYCN